MSNIIKFPKDKVKHPERLGVGVLTKEDIYANVQAMQHLHIDETVEFIVPIIFSQLSAAGFNITSEDIKQGAFILEAIRSVLCGIYGIEHPFHKIVDQVFVEEKKGHLRISDSVHVNFKDGTVSSNN